MENDKLDDLVEDLVKKEGFEYLGGMTSGYYPTHRKILCFSYGDIRRFF